MGWGWEPGGVNARWLPVPAWEMGMEGAVQPLVSDPLVSCQQPWASASVDPPVGDREGGCLRTPPLLQSSWQRRQSYL